MYFLRRAHEILISKPEKLLSPSFWDSEGITPLQHVGFDGAISGIEHPLGTVAVIDDRSSTQYAIQEDCYTRRGTLGVPSEFSSTFYAGLQLHCHQLPEQLAKLRAVRSLLLSIGYISKTLRPLYR